jgi:sigma-B regulation protein RsbU (phosphoserine phosphatase)
MKRSGTAGTLPAGNTSIAPMTRPGYGGGMNHPCRMVRGISKGFIDLHSHLPLLFAAGAVAVLLFALPPMATAQLAGPELDPGTITQLQSLLVDRLGFLVLGAAFLAIGLAVLMLVATRFEFRDDVILLFGIMSLLWGLRFVSRAPVIPLLIGGEPETWALFTRGLTYFSAPPAFAFVWRLFGRGWKSSVRTLTWVSTAFALIAILILAVDPDPDRLIRVFNIMILAGAIVIVISLLQPESRNHPELKKLVIGGLFSLVFIVLENLRSLDLVRIPFDVEWIGVIILYGTLGYMAAGHFIGVERRLTALQQELATARQIQFSILPHDPPAARSLAIATRYLPMTEVAGDFFDFAKVDTERCGFLIADVSGHGVPAALVAAMVKVAFQAQACHRETPKQVLAGMNEMLSHRLERQFVTAGYAFIDTAAGKLRYAGAGHPPLYILSGGGEVHELFAKGLMLGPFPEAQYAETEQDLAPGDRILMYTDGIVETFNRQEEEFGEERLKTLLCKGTELSAEEMADRLLLETKTWAGIREGDSLDDDLTLIIIDVLPGGNDHA